MDENGSGTAALGGGAGRRLKIAVAALGGGAAEEHAMMALMLTLASTLSKPRAYFCGVGISISKDGKRGCVQCKGHMSMVMARR